MVKYLERTGFHMTAGMHTAADPIERGSAHRQAVISSRTWLACLPHGPESSWHVTRGECATAS